MIGALRQYLIRKLGQNKGHSRIYLDSPSLAASGFIPGAIYSRVVKPDSKRITLVLNKEGSMVVSHKEKSGKLCPVIDLHNSQILSMFDGMEAVRIIVGQGRIHILPLASESKRAERLARLAKNLNDGALHAAGSAFGGGVLDHAAHAGLHAAGLDSCLVMANEIDEELLEHAYGANSCISVETALVCAPMQELVQDEWAMNNLPKADLFVMGIPCSGASIAGRSKRSLAMMENHPQVGHLIASALMLVNRINPSIFVVENVRQYAETASAQILRQHLRDSGYEVQETTLCATDFGCLENRERWFLVASTRGITVSLEGLQPILKPVRVLKDILDDVALDSPEWRSFDYLKSKEVRDHSKGNGFSMQVVNALSTSVPVLRKGYAKGGSTDPLVAHPENTELLRPFTVAEHARIKQVPESLVAGLNKTTGHALLGQGVAYAPVVALFKRIGEALLAWNSDAKLVVPQTVNYSLGLATG